MTKKTWRTSLLVGLAVFCGACGSGGGGTGGTGGSGSPDPGMTPAAPTVTLTANPTVVAGGGSSTLSWNSSNASSCTASGAWSGTKSGSGSEASGGLNATSTFTLECTGTGGSASAGVTVSVTGTGAIFPLRATGQHYFVDAQGNPFLVHGDAGWSMIAQLTDSEVDEYLNDRQQRGFNTVLVNLLERYYSDQPPKNVYGEAPFVPAEDFSKPNDAYFKRAVSYIRKAADRNMLVLLAPSYLGYQGSGDGWYQVMTSSANSLSDLNNYGKYIGQKFLGLDNIIWVEGGDYTPANLAIVDAVATGIRSVNSAWLHTYHGDPEKSAYQSASSYSWLDVNNVYSYADDLSSKVLVEYQRTPVKPLFLIESTYEGEKYANPNVPSTQLLRAHAYQAILAGASGQVFGNNPIWHFEATNHLSDYTNTWRQALSSEGSVSMERLYSLLSPRNWWLLQPHDTTVSPGHLALASDGSFALAYVTSPVNVQLGDLAQGGSSIAASWFNPWTQQITVIGTYPTSASHTFTPPNSGSNGNGTDWVLILEH